MNQAILAWSFRQLISRPPSHSIKLTKMHLFLTPISFELQISPNERAECWSIVAGRFRSPARSEWTFLSGSARTLDPTNKNYAPELSTFGIIIEVNRSEVQWTSLSLEKLPSWSQLISAPGKYELLVGDFRLSTLCINCGGSRFGNSRNTSLVFSRPGLLISYQN